MSWRAAGRRDLPAVLRFLLREEALCVPVTSRIRGGCRGCEIWFDEEPGGGITDCILYTSGGLLLPVLSSPPAHRRDLAGVISRLRPSVQSVMGVSRCVEEAEALVPAAATRRMEYFLMTLDRKAAHRLWTPPLAPGMRVRRADPADAAAIFPLQKAYEQEEVLLDPSHFSEALCMRSLLQGLRDEILFVLEIGGQLAAKAGTNARGYTVDQIGGVYTVPAQRGKGLARAAMAGLLKEVFREKAGASLFVKKKNMPAVALYHGLGFQPVTDYAISYYGF
jgi:uncharacterized protein